MKNTGEKIVIALLAVLFCIPIIALVIGSVTSPEEVSALYVNTSSDVYGNMAAMILPRSFSWRQFYEVLLAQPEYMLTFWNSVLMSLECVCISVAVSVLLGFVLAFTSFHGRKLAVRLIIVLMLLPWQAVMLPQYMLSKWIGVYNTAFAPILVQGLNAFGVFLMYQFMKNIPNDMIEAASLDTNSSMKVLWCIVCPNVVPGIAACSVLAFAESWNMVEQPLTLLERESLYPISLLVSDIAGMHMDIAFACCLVYMLPIVIIGVFAGGRAADSIVGIGGIRYE